MARPNTHRLQLTLLVASIILQGCTSTVKSSNNYKLAQRQICIHSGTVTTGLEVEVAATTAERKKGLQQRATLPENRGMLFEFNLDQPPERGFWMYRTLIPLDIAYLDKNGRILAIREMEPCASASRKDCQLYPPGQKYRYALEVNRGFFTANNVNPGALVSLNGATCNNFPRMPEADPGH